MSMSPRIEPGTFIVSTPKKFVNKVQKLTVEAQSLLDRGFKHSVDDFDYYFMSSWYPTFGSTIQKSKIASPKMKKRRPHAKPLKVAKDSSSFDKDLSEMKVLSMNDVEFFVACVKDAEKHVSHSKYLQKLIRNQIFCALNACKICAESAVNPPSIVEGSVDENVVHESCVTISTVEICDTDSCNIECNELKKTYDEKCEVPSNDGLPNAELLIENGIEANPGPTEYIYIPFGYPRDFLLKYKLVVMLDQDIPLKSKVVGGYVSGTRVFTIGFRCKQISPIVKNAFEHDVSLLWSKPPVDITHSLRLLLTQHGIELNPGPECNGNTKRNDDKKINKKLDKKQRLERLANRNDEIGNNAKRNLEKYIKEKRQLAAHNHNMKVLFPETQFNFNFSTNFNVTDDSSFLNELQQIINAFPPEIQRIVPWVDVVASVSVLLRNASWDAKYIAFRMLCDKLYLVSTDLHVLLGKLCAVLQYAKINTQGMPRTESFEESSALSVFIGIILTLFGHRSNQASAVKLIVRSLGDLSKTSFGIELLVKSLKKTLNYFKLCNNPENSPEAQIQVLADKVKFWLTREGENEYMTSPDGYGSVTNALTLSDEIFKVLPRSHTHQNALSTVRFHLRNMHKKVSLSPSSGHSFRKEPVVLHLTGAAGVGKTLMLNAIAADSLKYLFEIEKVPVNEMISRLQNFFQYVYWRPVGHQYETNYNTCFSRIYIVDDANQVAHKVTQNDIPFPARLIHVANNGDFLLPVAEIENKRNAKFNSDLIIATDNITDPDVSFLADPDAYIRRLTMRVEVSLKEAYSCEVNGIRVLDPLKTTPHAFDTNPYVFNYVGKPAETFDYAQLIDDLKKQLLIKFKNYNVNRTNLTNHALSHLNIAHEPPVINEVPTVEEIPLVETQADREDQGMGLDDVIAATDDEFLLLPGVHGYSAEEIAASHFGNFSSPHTPASSYVSESETISSLSSSNHSLYGTSYPEIDETLSFKEQFLDLMCSIFGTILGFSLVSWVISGSFATNSRDALSFCVRKYHDFKIFCICKWLCYKNSQTLRRDKKILLCVSGVLALCGAYGIYSLYSKKKKETENYSADGATKTKAKRVRRPKGVVRAVRSRESDVFEVSMEASKFANSVSESCKDNASFDLMKQLIGNTYVLEASSGSIRSRIVGTFITGRVFMCNAHILTGLDLLKTSFSLQNCFNSYLNISGEDITSWKMAYDTDESPHDVVFIEFPRTVKTHTNLSHHLINQSELSGLKGVSAVVFTLLREKDVWLIKQQHTHISDYVDSDVSVSASGSDLTYNWNSLVYRAQTQVGYCGSLIIINDPKFQRKICGMHMSSYKGSDECSAAVVVREYYDAVSLEISESARFSSTECYKEFAHEFRTVIDDSFDKVCTIPINLHSYSKSGIRKSLLHEKISTPLKRPAHLGIVNIEGESFHVLSKAMKKYLGPNLAMNSMRRNLFKSALHHLFHGKTRYPILSIEEAIRGNPDHKYRKAINRAASSGWPLCVSREPGKPGKTTFLGEGEDFIFDHPLVLSWIAAYIASAHQLLRYLCVFIITAKDELRLMKKVDEGATRGFGASPLPFMVLFRQYYLAIFSDIMENRISNSSLVGINPYGDDWDRAVRYLARWCGPNACNFMAGDFSNFDGTLNRDFLWEIFDFLEERCDRENDPVSRALWTDITQSYQVFGNVVIEVTRGQPSGNPGTTYINTLYNAGIMYVALSEILIEINSVESKEILKNLHNHYRALFYGDDNCFGFSDQFKNCVNISLITDKLAEFGHVYTSDVKTDSNLCYRPLTDISILKRKFVYDKVLRRWVAPLELSSILEPLNWDKVDNHNIAQKEEQMAVNARTALRELSFHTKDEYDKYSKLIRNECRNLNIALDSQCFLDHHVLRRVVKLEEDENPNWRDIYLGCQDEHSSSIEPCDSNERIRPSDHSLLSVTQSLRTNNENENSTAVGDIPFTNDETANVETGQQIITFETVNAPVLETVIEQESIDQKCLSILHEGRNHSISDVLEREYEIANLIIPPGGLPGQILANWDVMNIFLSQPNVQDKIAGFAFFRPDFIVRIEFTSVPTINGGVMLSYFPDIAPAALVSRTASLLQLSQAPNVQESLTTATTMSIRVPFISPFLARDMLNGLGRNGNVIFSRLTPSGPDSVRATVYLSVDKDQCDLSYPTPASSVFPTGSVKKRISKLMNQFDAKSRDEVNAVLANISETQMFRRSGKSSEADDLKNGVISGILDKGSKVASIVKGIPVIGAKAAAVAPLLSMGKSLAALFGLSKPLSDVPVRAIKLKPGDGHLTSEGVLPSHQFTINTGCSVSSSQAPFGSKADEMAVRLIMNTPNIINNTLITANNAANQVIAVYPLNLLQYQSVPNDNEIRMNHQMWVALLCNQFNADLDFGFSMFLTHFHRIKLRFSVLPGTYLNSSAIGSPFAFDKDMASSSVVEFTGSNTHYRQSISKRANSSMKMIPHGTGALAHSRTTLDANRNRVETSYGTLVVSIEVPLSSSSDTVSDSVYMVTQFSADNVELSNVADGLSWLPTTQMESINTEFHTVPRSKQAVETSPAHSNSEGDEAETNVSVCAGDNLISLKQILNAFTVFAPPTTLAVGAALRVRPFVRRSVADGVPNQSIDHLDYLIKGFAFFKGSINMRASISNPAFQGVVGNLGKINAWNQQAAGITPVTGTQVTLTGVANTGTRCIPIHSTEGVVDVTCPYYQPLHMTRALQNGSTSQYGESFENGLIYASLTVQTVQLYRAVGDDFRMGFLTALPTFVGRNALGWI